MNDLFLKINFHHLRNEKERYDSTGLIYRPHNFALWLKAEGIFFTLLKQQLSMGNSGELEKGDIVLPS